MAYVIISITKFNQHLCLQIYRFMNDNTSYKLYNAYTTSQWANKCLSQGLVLI